MDSKSQRKSDSKQTAAAEQGKPITECIRCGTCCKKGGPSFHHADKMLIDKGIIHSKYLYTIRKGELVYDNVKACLMSASSDLIKIKGKKDTWSCILFDENENACTIYKDRLLECKVFQCWDTREIESIYAAKRLTRKDLISEVVGLWDLIEDHQTRCDYEKIQNLAKALNGNKKDEALQKLREIIQYDCEIRKLVVSKAGLDAEALDFLFGRPLVKTIENFGFRVQKDGNKIIPTRTHRHFITCKF